MAGAEGRGELGRERMGYGRERRITSSSISNLVKPPNFGSSGMGGGVWVAAIVVSCDSIFFPPSNFLQQFPFPVFPRSSGSRSADYRLSFKTSRDRSCFVVEELGRAL